MCGASSVADMRSLLIWGATGHAKVLHEAIADSDFTLEVLVDNRVVPTPLPGVAVLEGAAGLDAWLAARGGPGGLHFMVAIGGARGADRLAIAALLQQRGLQPATLVHRSAFVARGAVLGSGCQVLAQAAVCAAATLGKGVIVNTAASVDHDCVLGDGVHLAPGARLAGEVVVGERVFIGTGAIVLPRVRIGADAVIGAGAVVLRDVAAGATMVGNPARVLP